ncbi:MAG: hypothetical protein GW823_11205 [Bacteroidetes bacterium]|nr:hypothetical protein [Bacteroidota bacterium]
MKVFLITQNEPFYIPKMLKVLINDSKQKDFQICGITVLAPHRKNKTIRSWIKERSQIYTYKELFLVTSGFIFAKLFNILRGDKSPYSVRSITRNNRIAMYMTDNINSESYLNILSKLDVDLIISISCPQIFNKKLLTTPRIACINAHGTLLPSHRGVFGSWWMLYCGDSEGGSTIHTMVEEVDKGEIIWQKTFKIDKYHTQFSIAYQTKKDMACGLSEVIMGYKNMSLQPLMPLYKSSYHYAPTKELGVDFHKKGNRVIRFRDLKYMLSNDFVQ